MNIRFNSIRNSLEKLGIAFAKTHTIKELVLKQRELERLERFHALLTHLNPSLIKKALRMLPHSKSENFQDVFVMLVLDEPRNGFFIEFGATDGVQGSNSYMLEKFYGWTGVLAEPARCWHASLNKNRSAKISHQCVWRESGMRLNFRETIDAGFSTLDLLADQDRHRRRRIAADIYQVETISLVQLLYENDAPNKIDYLSIDTEGSELEIISALDFNIFRPLVMTVEHNYRPNRSTLVSLMKERGYVQGPSCVSLFDEWFICQSLEAKMHNIFPLNDNEFNCD